jgi:hypothetical protein
MKPHSPNPEHLDKMHSTPKGPRKTTHFIECTRCGCFSFVSVEPLKDATDAEISTWYYGSGRDMTEVSRDCDLEFIRGVLEE